MPEVDFELLASMRAEFQLGIRRSLLEIAEPYSFEAVIRAFSLIRQELEALLETVDDVQIVHKPASNEFSISEVISHMITAQAGVYNALLDLSTMVMPLVNHGPTMPGAGAVNTLTVAKAKRQLQLATDELIELIRQIGRISEPTVREYPRFGKMSSKSWLMFQIAHDHDHIQQIKKVMTSDGYPTKNPVATI